MRKCFAFFLVAVTLLGGTGCSAINLEADPAKLMEPPVLSAEQEEMTKVLRENLGESYTFVYPAAGENRSAFIYLDGSQKETALVLYLQESTNKVQLCVLDKSTGRWKFSGQMSGEGFSVGEVGIASLLPDSSITFFIGYQSYSNRQPMAAYAYQNGQLRKILGDVDYLEVAPLDVPETTQKQLLVIEDTFDETQRTLSLYTAGIDGQLERVSYSPLLDSSKAEFHIYQKLDKGTGQNFIYIDGAVVREYFYTDAFVVDGRRILPINGTEGRQVRRITMRSSPQIKTLDVDGDGSYEVPMKMKSQDIAQFGGDDVEETLTPFYWGSIEKGVFREKYGSFYNTAKDYYYLFPASWLGKVRVEYTTDSFGERVRIFSATGGNEEELVEILVVSLEALDTGEVDLNGYMPIRQVTDRYGYFVKTDKPSADGTCGTIYIGEMHTAVPIE